MSAKLDSSLAFLLFSRIFLKMIPTVLSDVTGIGAEKRFTPSMIPDLKGSVWIITGGHSGIVHFLFVIRRAIGCLPREWRRD